MPRLLAVVPLVAAALLLGPGAARADDPPYLGWSELLPGLTEEFVPSSENDCTAGRTRCVDAVIREMRRRFDPLAASCDHDSIFALAYLRTTEEYRRTIEDPNFFDDTAFVNHEDAVFARYYFDAFDAWRAGRHAAVPPAWASAFRAAADHAMPASGNLSLGINAHVQRDLPFALAGIGLVKPDGSSRKPDHDRVNRFLNRVTDDLYAEIARRFDPTIDDSDLPGTGDDAALFQIIPTWREIAWRNAERLVSAGSAQARAEVAASIEAYAASQAEAIRWTTAYGPLRNSAARDAYCSTHHDS
ncbi:MAG TPA: DUF5995 family protein [Solirubrobacteraceae bacterium]|nr:DUF5995 family protein [Solirubrobacteraceae bacterium]